MFEELLDLPRWSYELGFALYVISVVLILVLERRRPTATLAWILALVFLPVVGLILYAGLGRRHARRGRRLALRRPTAAVADRRDMANLEDIPADLPRAQRGLVRLALRSGAAPLRRAGSVTLLDTPEAAAQAMLVAIRGAQRFIHMESYIWKNDATGQAIAAALADRARAGVHVRVLLDHLGTFFTSQQTFTALRRAGGRVESYGVVRFLPFRPASPANFRNHRKIAVIDAEVGFLGGLNIGDEYLGRRARTTTWRDLHARLDGDAVLGLDAIFCDDWAATTGVALDVGGNEAAPVDDAPPRRTRSPALASRWRRLLGRRKPTSIHPSGPNTPMASLGPLVQIIPSGPDRPVASALTVQFTSAIAGARDRLFIATPYFIPDEPLTLSLRAAALRGVDVRLLLPTPRYNDAPFVAWASRSYYDELLEAGCRIFEYQPGMYHAKYLVSDDQVCALGSANMDVRSLHLNYEVTAVFYNAGVASELAAIFTRDLDQSLEVSPLDREDLGLREQFLEGLARLLSPVL